MALSVQPLLANGEWVTGEGAVLTVLDKYQLLPDAQVSTAGKAQADSKAQHTR